MAIHGSGKKNFPCRICGKAFSLRDALKRHSERVHRTESESATVSQKQDNNKSYLKSSLTHIQPPSQAPGGVYSAPQSQQQNFLAAAAAAAAAAAVQNNFVFGPSSSWQS